MSTYDDNPRDDERSIAVRLRDREHCQVCKDHSGPLDVHAIVDDEAANQLSNYILLCRECHQKAHREAGRSTTE